MVDTNNVLNITDESFETVTGEGVTVVDFWADWCMPCRMQGPIVESVAAKIGDKATVAKLDVDSNPMTPGQLGITGIPTLVFMKDGAEARRLVGVQSEEKIIATVESLLES
jgi:thioredoxin 1